MTLAYATLLGLYIYLTDVEPKKIDGSTFSTYSIVLANFEVEDKQERTRFLHKTLLVADTAMKIVLEMPFLALSKVEVNFVGRELSWKTYSLNKVLPITK